MPRPNLCDNITALGLRGVDIIWGANYRAPRRVICASLVAFCVTCASGAGAAEPDYDITVALGLETNGVFRGIKSRKLNPSVYGVVELSRGDFFAGAYATPVHIAGENNALLLSYVGVAPSALSLDFNFAARYYAFPGSSDISFDIDDDEIPDKIGRKGVFEVAASVSKPFENGKVTARAFWTPNSLGETGGAYYFNLEARLDLVYDVQLRGQGGLSRHADDRYNDDYADWGIGLYRSVGDFDLFVRYSDTFGLAGSDDRIVVFGIERALTLFSRDKARERRYRKIRNFSVDKSLFAGGH